MYKFYYLLLRTHPFVCRHFVHELIDKKVFTIYGTLKGKDS